MSEVLRTHSDRILMVDLAYQFLRAWKRYPSTVKFVVARESDLLRDAALFRFLPATRFSNVPEARGDEAFTLPLSLADGRVLKRGFSLDIDSHPECLNWVEDTPPVKCVYDAKLDDFEDNDACFCYFPNGASRLDYTSDDDKELAHEIAMALEEEMQERLLAWGGDKKWNINPHSRTVPQDASEYWISMGYPPEGPPMPS